MPQEITQADRETVSKLLKQAASKNPGESAVAQEAIAAELVTPLRQGVLTGDIISSIYTTSDKTGTTGAVEYPVDLYRTDNANDYVAYTIPHQGSIPSRLVNGDYVTVPTYSIGNGIDILLRYIRDGNWDVLGRAMEVMEAGFTKKKNDDGWHTILAAGVDRNIIVNDSNATAGQLTKLLLTSMKSVMRRNSGGNSTSINRGRLTHLFMSPEAMDDIRNWDNTVLDEVTRREVFVADDGSYSKIYGVNLVDLDELGDNQLYETYFESTLGGSLPSGDLEILVGLDLSKADSFIMPIKENLAIFSDPTLHRQQRMGFYGTFEGGFACLNGARTLLGSI